MGTSALAAVPDGVWSMPEPTGLEFTDFTTDGERYILYNPTAKLFFASGNGWNTMASLRTFGMEIWVQESAEEDAPEGSYELWDNNVNNPARSTGELNIFTDDGNSTWVDHGTQGNYSWGVEVKDGLVRFQNVALIADKPEFEGMYLGFDGTYVVADNSAGDSNHRDAYTAILRHVDPSTAGAGVDFKAVTIDSYEAFVASDEYEAYQSGVKTYLASIGLKEAIESAEALSIDVTDALAVYSDKASSAEDMAKAASNLKGIIEAKDKLKAAIDEYEGKGFTGTADAKAVLNNSKATIEEVNQAKADLETAFVDWGKNNASVENPADMTSKIVNPHFDNGDATTGWSGDAFGRGGTVSDGAEHYSKNYDTYQTITGLAPGLYCVGVYGYYRSGNYGGDAENHWLANDDASRYAKLYAKVGETTFETPIANVMSGAQTENPGANEVTYTDPDTEEEVTVYVPNTMAQGDVYFHTLHQYANKLYVAVDESGELTIGVKKTSQIGGDWSMFDDFSLSYLGTGADAAKLYLDETLKNYGEYTPEEGTIYTASYLTAYQDAINANDKVAENLAAATAIITGIDSKKKDLDKNIELWQNLKDAVEKGQKMSIDPKYNGLITIGYLADYCNDDYELIEEAAKLTNEELEAELVKVNELTEAVMNEAKADVHDGKDMTDFIVNPTFETSTTKNTGTSQGWTVDRIDGGNVTPGPINGDGDKFLEKCGYYNGCFESWHCHKWDVWQEITDLPVGMYELEVQGYVRCEVTGYNKGDELGEDYPSPVYLYMNNAKSQFPSVYSQIPAENGIDEFQIVEDWTQEEINGNYFPNSMGGAAQCFYIDKEAGRDGMYKTTAYGLIAKQGDKFRIGVKMDANQDWWCIWDNFKLTYKTPTVEVVKPILDEELAKIDLSKPMGSNVYGTAEELKTKAAAAAEAEDGTKMFNVLADVYDLSASIQSSIALFEKMNKLGEELQEAIDASEAEAATKTAANDLRDKIFNGFVENSALTDEEAQALIDAVADMEIKLALPAGMADASDENPVECTGVIKSPSFETADMESTSEGWTNPGNLGNDDEQRSALAIEFWQTNFDMFQTIKGLPAGTYKMTVNAWVRLGSNEETYKAWNEDPNATMAYAYAVDGDSTVYAAPVANLMKAGDNLSGSQEFAPNEEEVYYMPNTLVEGHDLIDQNEGLFTTEVICKVLEDGVLTIGIKKAETVTNSWVVLDDFRLFYLGANSSLTPSGDGTGINNAEIAGKKVEFFSIGGARVSKPGKGVAIMKTTGANGDVKYQKVMIK